MQWLLLLWLYWRAKQKPNLKRNIRPREKKKHDAHYAITIHRLVHFIWNSFIKIHLVRAQEVCAWIIEYFFA